MINKIIEIAQDKLVKQLGEKVLRGDLSFEDFLIDMGRLYPIELLDLSPPWVRECFEIVHKG